MRELQRKNHGWKVLRVVDNEFCIGCHENQEPLWNVQSSLFLLHDRLRIPWVVRGALMLLVCWASGHGSCAPENFLTGDPSHVLSVVYVRLHDLARHGRMGSGRQGKS